MGILEVMQNMKGGYYTEEDSADIMLDYDVDGVKIHRMVKAWHIGEDYYELQYNDPELIGLKLGWFTAVKRDGVLTVVVRNAEEG